MSSVLLIRDPLGERPFTAEDFPLALGGAGSAIRLAAAEEARGKPAAYLGLHEEQFYLQPADDVEVLHNSVPSRKSVWLRTGDVVNIGEARLRLVADAAGPTLVIEDGSAGNITAPPVVDSTARITGDTAAAEDPLQPISFRSPAASGGARRGLAPRRFVTGTVALLLVAAVWFVFTSVSLTVLIAPGVDPADRVSVTGTFPALDLGARFLLRPGTYSLTVERPGFVPLARDIEVGNAASQTVDIVLQKLPGRLRIELPVEASLRVDAEQRGTAPAELELSPGAHTIALTAPRYQEYVAEVQIEGGGTVQALAPELVPRWAKIAVTTEPTGAELVLGGESRGVTPLEIEVLAGTYPMELRRAGFRTWQSDLRVEANIPQQIGPIRLGLPDGRLVVRSQPAGASVSIGGAYRGQTPLEIDVRPDLEQPLSVTRPGYEPAEQRVSVAAGGRRVVEIPLTGIYGELELVVQPADAQLFVDGEARGTGAQTLRLIATSHDIEIRKAGYVTHQATVTPRPGVAQRLDVTLLTPEASLLAAIPASVRTASGGELRLMPVGKFTLGSSRREPGRRANEAPREVELRRRFYLGTREVTNEEFRRFRAEHRSGFVAAHSLDLERQPVVNVSWQQAAAFCNWLSAQDKLPAAYAMREGSLAPVSPATTGYRLPTESEWEFAARYAGGGAELRYPWGDALPVAPGSGNFADQAGRIVLQDIIPGYDDGYPATAPVGSFPANRLGLFDMGGNVAEWTQDVYTVTTDSTQVAVDPVGTGDGAQRVIRGSSWRQSGVTDLRLAARDFGTAVRNDLGFRIARYAE